MNDNVPFVGVNSLLIVGSGSLVFGWRSRCRGPSVSDSSGAGLRSCCRVGLAFAASLSGELFVGCPFVCFAAGATPSWWSMCFWSC